MSAEVLRIVGARQHKLKDLSFAPPLPELIVMTGVRSSGPSRLACATLYTEGQRRYVERFSAYARQCLERIDKPQVERVEGMPPALALDQSHPMKNVRSTVGTMTEFPAHIRLLFAPPAFHNRLSRGLRPGATPAALPCPVLRRVSRPARCRASPGTGTRGKSRGQGVATGGWREGRQGARS